MTISVVPIVIIISFYLRIVLFALGIVVLVFGASNLIVEWCLREPDCAGDDYKQVSGAIYLIIAGIFQIVFPGVLNIVLSFMSKGLVLIFSIIIDVIAIGIAAGAGVTSFALDLENYGTHGLIECSIFCYVSAGVVLAVIICDIIELRVHGKQKEGKFSKSPRKHKMTIAALRSNPFRPHSVVAYSEDPPASIKSAARSTRTDKNLQGKNNISGLAEPRTKSFDDAH